ncbi:MAG: Dabb family protein [Verrucomicrobiales bacterium]|nr:Dabb family protein [Verrucomicrobiales bacterium]
MVRHNVFFWLDESLNEEDRTSFEGGLKALFEIDVVTNGNFGKSADTPERPVTQNSYDYALFLEFDDVEKHNAYQVHPEHSVFVENFSKWFKQVRVYDTEMAG